jgi:phosphopantothenoylcysteine decarboxylase/phosphopantothenate--cysteine ligase
MACGEFGFGRLSDIQDILSEVMGHLRNNSVPNQSPENLPLAGKSALVTSGPTHEPIDPVRYIANHSSGRQGHAIAEALHDLGADVTLISGPVQLDDPAGINTVHITTAQDMLEACLNLSKVDIVICAAAVADWHVRGVTGSKIKKQNGRVPTLDLCENPDILKTLAQAKTSRASLVIGFAAETENVIEHAKTKRLRKGCDWIIANDVSQGTMTFGGTNNQVHLINDTGVTSWPSMTKVAVAQRLSHDIADFFTKPKPEPKP